MDRLPPKERKLFPGHFTPSQASTDITKDEQLAELLTNYQQLYRAGEALQAALKEYQLGEAIPLAGHATTCGQRLFNNSKELTYAQFTEVVDRLAKHLSDKAAAIWSQSKGLNNLQELDRREGRRHGGSLWEALKAGLGLVTLFVTAKLINVMNGVGNSMLLPPADGWFDGDALVGIALYLLLSGNIEDLPLLKELSPEVHERVLYVQSEGPEKILKNAGIDPDKIRRTTEEDDLRCLYQYALEYISTSTNPAEYDHWLAYAIVVKRQQHLLEVLKRRQIPGLDPLLVTISRPRRVHTASYREYLYYYYNQTRQTYYQVDDLFRQGWSPNNTIIDPCCIYALLGEALDTDEYADTFDKLAKMTYFASLTPRSHWNILTAFLKRLLLTEAQTILLELAEFIDGELADLEALMGRLSYEIPNVLYKCVPGSRGLSDVWQSARERLYTTLNGILIELDGLADNFLSVSSEVTNHRRLLQLASLFRYLSEQPESLWIKCKEGQAQDVRDQVLKARMYPQLKVEEFLDRLPKPGEVQ